MTLLACLMTALLSFAANFEVDGISYNITSSESLTVEVTSGNSKYTGSVTIPETVTYDGKTYSVTSIGNRALESCNGLTSVEIPNSITSIGSSAFYYCNGLTSIKIPDSVTRIDAYAFEGCSRLTSIRIPISVTSIGGSAFVGCSGLTSIVVDKGNTVYDSREDCNALIETATNTLKTGCMNTVIPKSVTSIGQLAFEKCTGLTSITIPNSVTSISVSAFSWCSGLTSITIPNSVTSIADRAFEYCTGLTSFIIAVDDPIELKSYVFWTSPTSKYGENYIFKQATLYVPKGCKAAYEEANVWKLFENILELDPTGIEAIEDAQSATQNAVRQGIYTLTGERVSGDAEALQSLPRGIYVVDGKKRVVK